ncbi:MAG: MarR family transcriptional regulator [Nocardioidaceae bacterium]|nr:MarR family transcriptional regulator [Nocardioidaceae bacterium]MCL2613952.1 MarR family transcriptional regulator [Nocardioidaceae bacterium]
MTNDDLEAIASQLALGVSLLRRRLRQLPATDEATIPEMSALVRLQRSGPATNAELAKAEQISPQSMKATLKALEERGMVDRTSDPADGRRVVLSITPAGAKAVTAKRAVRSQQLAGGMAQLTSEDIDALRAAAPVLERLAEAL